MLKAIEIIAIEVCGDSKIIICRCLDTKEYREHPHTFYYLGDLFTKTGWSNDREEVYYRV